MSNVMKGVCHFHSETGTEGGYWAFQDERFITKTGMRPPMHESWSYEGLHPLKDGDRLTIFDKADPTKVVWQGVIALRQLGLFTDHAKGMWIHADQDGIDRDTWATWFFNENPAELTPA